MLDKKICTEKCGGIKREFVYVNSLAAMVENMKFDNWDKTGVTKNIGWSMLFQCQKLNRHVSPSEQSPDNCSYKLEHILLEKNAKDKNKS